MHIADAIANRRTDELNENREKPLSVIENLLSRFFKFLPNANDRNTPNTRENGADANRELLQSFCNRKKPIIYRVHPMQSIDIIDGSDFDEIAHCPYHAFVSRNHAPKFLSDFTFCRIRKVPADNQHKDATSTNFLIEDDSPVPKLSTELTVRVFILEDMLEKCSKLDEKYFNVNFRDRSVYLSYSLRLSLNLKIGAKVSLLEVDNPSEKCIPSSIELFSWKDSVSAKLFEAYVKAHSRHKELLINSCSALVLDDETLCVVRISPENCTSGAIDEKGLKGIQIHVKSVIKKNKLRVPEHLDDEYFDLGKVYTR